jgi:hypothetical protein
VIIIIFSMLVMLLRLSDDSINIKVMALVAAFQLIIFQAGHDLAIHSYSFYIYLYGQPWFCTKGIQGQHYYSSTERKNILLIVIIFVALHFFPYF